MKTAKRKKGIKEYFRKTVVSLKQRPHTIPLILLLITFLVYSLQLSLVSSTTGVINKSPMGLCTFMEMLFSLLSMVTFLNAFPKRQKPRVILVVLLGVLIAVCAVSDILFLVKIQEGIDAVNEQTGKPLHDLTKNYFILDCKKLIIAHLICLGVSSLAICSIPLLRILFNKIDTSVEIEDQQMSKIETEDE